MDFGEAVYRLVRSNSMVSIFFKKYRKVSRSTYGIKGVGGLGVLEYYCYVGLWLARVIHRYARLVLCAVGRHVT